MNYVMRGGKRIEIETLETGSQHPKKRKPFKAQFVMVPLRWIEALQRSKSASAYQLALVILLEAFKLEAFKRKGGEIILSSTATKMPRNTKTRAAKELADLGLIEIKLIGNQALKVSIISTTIEE
jgi:hypothetical protein